jgi:hypothetical protein
LIDLGFRVGILFKIHQRHHNGEEEASLTNNELCSGVFNGRHRVLRGTRLYLGVLGLRGAISLLVMETTVLKAKERATAMKKTSTTANVTIWVTIGP